MTDVYRLCDSSGALLYVGCTDCIDARLSDHRHKKAWWLEVASVDLTHFATRAEALEAESKAIAEESPRYNRNRPMAYRFIAESKMENLGVYVRHQRSAGVAWERIARNLWGLAGIPVFGETLRSWYPDDRAGAA